MVEYIASIAGIGFIIYLCLAACRKDGLLKLKDDDDDDTFSKYGDIVSTDNKVFLKKLEVAPVMYQNQIIDIGVREPFVVKVGDITVDLRTSEVIDLELDYHIVKGTGEVSCIVKNGIAYGQIIKRGDYTQFTFGCIDGPVPVIVGATVLPVYPCDAWDTDEDGIICPIRYNDDIKWAVYLAYTDDCDSYEAALQCVHLRHI